MVIDIGITQPALEGIWSGYLISGADVLTVVMDVGFDGQIFFGLQSDFTEIVVGDFLLLDGFDEEVELSYFTTGGLDIYAHGFLSGASDRATLAFSTDDGAVGDLVLERTFGPGTFDEDLFEGSYEFELFDPDDGGLRTGVITLDRHGDLVFGELDLEPIKDATFVIVDPTLGEFQATLYLLGGEVIFIDGLLGFADQVVAGLYEDDFTVDGLAVLLPL